MKKLIIGLVFLTLAACTKDSPVCGIAKTISAHVSDEIAVRLECSNKEAIKATIDLQLAKFRVCEEIVKTQSIIGDVVCAPLVDGILNGALTKVPPEWGCTGAPVKDALRAPLIQACKKSL